MGSKEGEREGGGGAQGRDGGREMDGGERWVATPQDRVVNIMALVATILPKSRRLRKLVSKDGSL